MLLAYALKNRGQIYILDRSRIFPQETDPCQGGDRLLLFAEIKQVFLRINIYKSAP